MNKIKSFVVALVFVLSKSALFFAACVSGDCVAARVKMLEEQAKIVGILNIDTYKRAFGVHHELAQIISERAGVSPEYYGISFETKKMNQYVIGKKNPFEVIDYHPESKYVFSVPVLSDYVVMISRNGEKPDFVSDIEVKICASYPCDIVSGDWIRELGITKFDDENSMPSSACKKILDEEADVLFLPLRVAEVVFEMLELKDKLYISRPLFEINYRFAFDENNQAECELINNTIIKMIESGELQQLYRKYGLSQSQKLSKNSRWKIFRYLIIFLTAGSIANLFVLFKIAEKTGKLEAAGQAERQKDE